MADGTRARRQPKTDRNEASPRFQPVRRGHAADTIFEQLAAAILRGEFEVGAPLPAERLLGEEFGVSRIVVRQAVHRLADVGLVAVRQGGATTVRDPAEAGDIRLIGLYYSLAPGGKVAREIRRDTIEKQFLQGLSLVDVCARRAGARDKKKIHDLALAIDENAATEKSFAAFEEAFWRAVARAGGNRIFEMEVAWWYGALADARPTIEASASLKDRIAFYRELARRLVGGDHPTQYYLAVVSPQLEALFG